MEYTKLEDGTIERTNDDGSKSYIPVDPNNSDYKEYLNSSEAKIK